MPRHLIIAAAALAVLAVSPAIAANAKPKAPTSAATPAATGANAGAASATGTNPKAGAAAKAGTSKKPGDAPASGAAPQTGAKPTTDVDTKPAPAPKPADATIERGAAAAPDAPDDVNPPKGEILLSGKVQTITETGRLILLVSRVRQADGTVVTLSPPRPKQAIITGKTHIHVRGNPAKQVSLKDLVSGTGDIAAMMIGRDTGPGMDIPVVDVSVWTAWRGGKYVFEKPTP